MKYFIIVGEASGDLHASNLIKSIKQKDPSAEFMCFGGDLMRQQGANILKHYSELAFMGFVPVVMNMHTILKNMSYCKKEIIRWKPDAVILVDYPGFNLKIAKFVKKNTSIPVYYYISPKIWAWKEYRIKALKRYVDQVICILPFEIDFYERYNYNAIYVGNPTLDEVVEYKQKNATDTIEKFRKENNLSENPIIAILAGSRIHEIKDNLASMIKAASTFSSYQIVIAGAPNISNEIYDEIIDECKNKIERDKEIECHLIENKTYRLLSFSEIALVTSGTATLETALFLVPQVVCYKTFGKGLANWIFKNFMNAPYISLVNLIAGKEVVKELFGKFFTIENIRKELKNIIENKEYRNKMMSGYHLVENKIGTQIAPKEAAELIINSINENEKINV